ncbi:hotdog domain-containing protein [uncultured Algimonas sp.]|uniref:acyl-CoA thioesterase n=1 Tax=uncultured Algimonas sp. TaxID=1547920 RepID=UPI002603C8A7|nr:hotdog domain-containing protein [uncultured Algimonas sp.]
MKFLSRRLVMPADLNSRGTLFGGRLLAWIDEEASVYAAVESGAELVATKYISEMDFQAPAMLGDVVEIGMEITNTTRVSITLRCSVRELRSKRDIVRIDRMVFVAIDDNGRPTRLPCGPGLSQSDSP